MSNLDNSNSFQSLNTMPNQPQTVTSTDVKNGTIQVGQGDSVTNTRDIIEQLVKVFPAGLTEGAIVSKLMSTFGIEKDVAKACYDAAVEQIAANQNKNPNEIKNNPALVSGEDKKQSMDKLNDWGNYQKQMLDMQNSANTQGGD